MLWTINLRHLRAFAATVRLGSISAAAQAVGITQPAITQGLTKLEKQLGQTLFERRPRGMVATEAAQIFARRATRALSFVGSTRVTMSQMRALLMLAEAGNYPVASQISGLAQPTLHRAVADLSIALRRSLVERRGKGIGFTDAGRRTIRAFRLGRSELEAGLGELERLKGREVGRISVGAMPLSRARVLPAAAAAFCAKYPEVRISIVEGSFGELIDPLRDGDLDLMIGALRNPHPGADVKQSALFEDRPAIIARKNHPLVGTNPTVAKLAEFSWVVAPVGTPLNAQWKSIFDTAATALPAVPVECGSVIAIRQLLIATDFLTLLSRDQVAVELEAGWLSVIAETPAGLSRTIGITSRTDWQPTKFQAAFVAELEATVREIEFVKSY